ncbi:MAG: phospholipase D family protein [Rhodobacteraceae bacterium]|nr:phospholipase D family protein [Paracoccaceae bacterium]
MCEFLQGAVLSQKIREVVKGKNARCAVAFWGKDAEKELFGPGPLEWSNVQIVCDLSMGGTNPATLRALGAPDNPNIRYLDGLHAKVFMSDLGAVVGSANASNNGIGFMGGNAQLLEAGTYFGPDSDSCRTISDWFDDLSKRKSKRIDSTALNAAQLAWNSRRKGSAQSNVQIDRGFLDYDPEVHGLVHVLWRNWNGNVKEYCSLDGLQAPRSWQNLATEDYDIINSWVADFLPEGRNSEVVFFFANDVRRCAEIHEEYPLLYFQNKKKETQSPPFNFEDEMLSAAYLQVIMEDRYEVLRCAPDRGRWLVRDHLHDMHRFWRDVQEEYRRRQGGN